MGLNKGEWSELYAILYLLENRNLKIVDSELNVINDDLFIVQEIISERKEGNVVFFINSDSITPIIFAERGDSISVEQIREIRQYLYNAILNAETGLGSFDINFVRSWLQENQLDTKFKARSDMKKDITLKNQDTRSHQSIELAYSVKSQLGRPATILNASNHTDFCYKILNFPKNKINEINEINTATKLVDRIQCIKDLGGIIQFSNVKSSIFDFNLRLIDSQLPQVLGEILLLSYTSREKDLYKLFESTYRNPILARKKLRDFLFALSFGLFPGKQWDGKYSVNGGIILVSSDSNVYVLDMLYFEEEVERYLFNETKLDSPSSTRYNMLNLYEEDNEVYFTLNLQIRYK